MSGNELPGGSLDKQWYVLKGRDILGPFSGHAVNDMVRDGTIGSDVRVAPVGGADWQPLSVLTNQVVNAPRTAPAAAGQRHYAGFWIRVGAYLLDAIIVNICVFVISFTIFFVLGVIFAMSTGSGDMLMGWINRNKPYLNFIGIFFWFFYETLFVGGRWQATPGKRICNIHIIREDGTRIGYARALGRFLCYFLDSIILMIGFMMAGWTQEKTALHDLICGTRVVYGRPQPRAREVAGSF